MAPDLLSLKEHRDYIDSMVAQKDQTLYQSMKHAYLEGAFKGRIFVVYKAAGITNGVPNPPQILTYIKVHDFEANAEFGSDVEVEDTSTHDRLWIGYIPEKLWGYNLFMSTPTRMQTTWCANRVDGGVRHTLLFGVILRAQGRTENCVNGVTYCLTPKKFAELYPNVELNLH